MIDDNRYSAEIAEKIGAHRKFWDGEGPSLIFIPPGETQLYDMTDYVARFEDPALMFEFEAARAEAVNGWPTDGIPTVRPSLGTVFVPAVAGQQYQVNADQMPWPGRRLTMDEILAVSVDDVAETPMYRKAKEFYDLAAARKTVVSYHADTQGVFDIAHILYGEEIFLEMAMEERAGSIRELLGVCLSLYLEVSDRLKTDVGEGRDEMIHGHGTPQGLYFPNAGVRISEDSATLISPEMIESFLGPVIRESMAPYGGGFVHYCGRHEFLFEWLCRNELVRAVDLGNPEMYDLDFITGAAGETGTVLYSRVAPLEGEAWRPYLERIAKSLRKHGTRCVLRPLVYPEDRDECRDMLEMWRDLTS